MKVPTYARYDYCAQRACDFLEEYNIHVFPFDIEKIIHENGWGLVTYSELMEKFSSDRSTVIRCLGSKDGYTQLDDAGYCIAYNDDDQLGNRKRFTLMHEIGHIYLKHLEDFEATRLFRGSLSKQENKVLENEANAFARNVLVPTTLFHELKNKSASNISKQFAITPTAAETRITFFDKDECINKQLGILPRLYKIVQNFYYKKKCNTCGASLVQRFGDYCPICGNKTLQWGDGKMIYKIQYKLNENSRLCQCSVCENENISNVATYCQICGAPVQNKCTSCGKLASADARYCIYCSSKTTFNSKLLQDWRSELDEITSEKNANYVINSFLDLPDEDDELPFN